MAVAATPIAPRAAARVPGLPAVLPRVVAFAALAGLGLVTWSGLVAPAPTSAAVATAIAAACCAGGLAASGAIGSRAVRNATLAAIVLALLAVVLLGAGVPARLLAPDRWGDLVGGVLDGVAALPGTLVPYRGADVWVRRVLLLGGTLLTAIAVLQGFWPRERGRLPGSPAAAAVSLGTLYAVPVISRSPDRPFLSGALFTVFLCAFLLADRVRGAAIAPAVLLVTIVTVGAAALAPTLDRPAPWVDYEHLADDVAGRGTVGYRWDHTYTPIEWPRTGRELLRIRAQSQAYWKTEVLDGFDGRTWRRTGSVAALEPEGDQDRTQPQWFQTIAVRVRGLRSTQFVTAGSAERVFQAPRQPINAGGGTYVTQRGVLRRGAEYRARVYTPRPTPGQLQRADPPGGASIARQWLRVTLPQPGTAPGSSDPDQPWAEASFPPYGSAEATQISLPDSGIPRTDGAEVISRTALGRIYALSLRLRAASDSPYDYVRRVRERVQRGATYTERPGQHADPLDAFLFDDRAGYCQHFSGAMALLLRMGGVPARIAVGFSPGTLDRGSGEYVVRDLDAHSWVEAYFPRYGWVTFDPTPSASPAREQVADQREALTRSRGRNPGGDRPGDPGFGGGTRAGRGGGGAAGGRSPWLAVGGALAALALGGAAVFALLVRRRERALDGDVDPELAELERALRRTGRAPAPGVTLAALERGLAADPGARAYLRALSARRYGRGAPPPTAAQRSGLRRELAAGLGPSGRLRAWWALPPRPR